MARAFNCASTIARSMRSRFRSHRSTSKTQSSQHLTDETRGVDTAISRLEREIELLREYRTRLVADVVTGKLDVREAAARLPDEAPPDVTEDDPMAADEEGAEDAADAEDTAA